jgi:hypothetical protein
VNWCIPDQCTAQLLSLVQIIPCRPARDISLSGASCLTAGTTSQCPDLVHKIEGLPEVGKGKCLGEVMLLQNIPSGYLLS